MSNIGYDVIQAPVVDLPVVITGVRVDRRASDAMADGTVFMRIPGIYGVLPLMTLDCECQ